jgi:hypothetical protein
LHHETYPSLRQQKPIDDVAHKHIFFFIKCHKSVCLYISKNYLKDRLMMENLYITVHTIKCSCASLNAQRTLKKLFYTLGNIDVFPNMIWQKVVHTCAISSCTFKKT